MVVKWGRMGKFMACPKYPACKNTKNLEQSQDGSLRVAEAVQVDEACVKCGKPMTVKQGRFGRFLACTGYPECKSTKPINQNLGIACPKCGSGHVVVKRSRKGRSFYGCDSYPACDFVSWGKPVDKACPACGAKYLVEKVTRAGSTWQCAAEGCGHREEAQAPAAAAGSTS
jgi:DNA topoisomerase-1